MDGVLVDSYDVWFHVLNHAVREFAGGAVSRETFAELWGQGIQQDVARFFPHKTIPEVEAFYQAHFMDHATHLSVDPDAGRVVRAVHEAGLRQALITNTPSPLARDILAHAKLELDAVVGGTDVPNGKPAPDMVLEACRRLGVAPREALVVGDSHYDRAAAAAAKVRFVGLRIDGERRIEALRDLLSFVG